MQIKNKLDFQFIRTEALFKTHTILQTSLVMELIYNKKTLTNPNKNRKTIPTNDV